MADNKSEPTQQTRPRKGKPIDIPVPKRKDIDKLLARATKGSATRPKK